MLYIVINTQMTHEPIVLTLLTRWFKYCITRNSLCYIISRYRLKSGSGTFTVSGKRKDVIVTEASAHFNLRKQIIVFQDGTEVPYTRNKGIKYPYKAKASEKLYLLHVSERRGICSNIYKHNFLEDLQYFDDKMDDFAFPIVNFRHISTCTT